MSAAITHAVAGPVLPPLTPNDAPADVVGLGEGSVDLILTVDAFPQPDGKTTALAQARLPGGQVATAIRALGRLGWRAVFAGSVGGDEGGDFLLSALAGDGVDVAAARRVAGVATRSAVIVVDRTHGTRSVIEHRDPRLNLPDGSWPLPAVRGARVLLVDGTDMRAAVGVARAARESGVRVVVDVDEAARAAAPLLALADVVIASEGFVSAAGVSIESGLAALAARNPQAAVVCVTLGRRGCLALARGTRISVPAFDVPCVDSTGAGDVFRAGVIAAWLETPSGPEVQTALRYACAAAALSCGGPGAQGALPRAAEVRALLDSGRVVTS
jgi:sulfofructose kinase